MYIVPTSWLPTSKSFFVGVSCFIALLLYLWYISRCRPIPGFPIACSDPIHFQQKGRSVLAQGLKQFPDGFQVRVARGWQIFLPNRYADQLRNNPHLSFNEAFANPFMYFPGFQGIRLAFEDDQLLQQIARKKLTPSLHLVTEDLVAEGKEVVSHVFGSTDEWKAHSIKHDAEEIIARMTLRVFLGEELCKDARVHRIFTQYTVRAMQAAKSLGKHTPLLIPIVYWFNTECRHLRWDWKELNSIMQPVFQKQCREHELSVAAQKSAHRAANTVAWMVESAEKRPHTNLVAAQLALSMAAMHTSSETLVNNIVGLCEAPEIVSELRKEIVQVLKAEGWSKVSLSKMKLLDSFMKEVQRKYRMNDCSMYRLATQSVTLADGRVIPRGNRLMISNEHAFDPAIYSCPQQLDAKRYLRMRQVPGQESKWSYVSPSADQMGFGYGQHACPGRFFADNMLKVALCIMLLKYDFRFVPGELYPKRLEYETKLSQDPTGRIQVRGRKTESSLDDCQEGFRETTRN